MRTVNVNIGDEYSAMVSGRLARVRLVSESRHGGWNGTNVATGRKIHIRSAQRLRSNLSAVDRANGRPASTAAYVYTGQSDDGMACYDEMPAAKPEPIDLTPSDDDEPQGGILWRPGAPGGPRVAIPVTRHPRPGSQLFEPVDASDVDALRYRHLGDLAEIAANHGGPIASVDEVDDEPTSEMQTAIEAWDATHDCQCSACRTVREHFADACDVTPVRADIFDRLFGPVTPAAAIAAAPETARCPGCGILYDAVEGKHTGCCLKCADAAYDRAYGSL